jgi:hypothetical protein
VRLVSQVTESLPEHPSGVTFARDESDGGDLVVIVEYEFSCLRFERSSWDLVERV